jgi:hypothetical protein
MWWWMQRVIVYGLIIMVALVAVLGGVTFAAVPS